MESALKTRLQSIELGEPQVYKNIAIVPIISAADGRFRYDALGEALASGDLAINEVSSAGSVPELTVVNRGHRPVLLVDGEELAGAKQNRVLNTSILLKETSETKIPVSCTEQGRWAYASKTFGDSGTIMALKSRSRKTSSVHFSLESTGTFSSNQREVWANIDELQAKSGIRSPTSAMHDVFKAREEDLRQSDEIFKPVPNQIGFVAFIGGAPAGLDMLSLTSVYTKLHRKLVRSYALEGLLVTKQQAPVDYSIPAQAHGFLEEIATAEEREFSSLGHGTDHRFKSKSIAGTMLVHENEIIHAAFFHVDETKPEKRPTFGWAQRLWRQQRGA